jgi:hypothetical protein
MTQIPVTRPEDQILFMRISREWGADAPRVTITLRHAGEGSLSTVNQSLDRRAARGWACGPVAAVQGG